MTQHACGIVRVRPASLLSRWLSQSVRVEERSFAVEGRMKEEVLLA